MWQSVVDDLGAIGHWCSRCWPDVRQALNSIAWASLAVVRTLLYVVLAPLYIVLGTLEVLVWLLECIIFLVDFSLECLE